MVLPWLGMQKLLLNIAWIIYFLQNVHTKYGKPSFIFFLSGSTTLNDSISCVQPLYICSKFYR